MGQAVHLQKIQSGLILELIFTEWDVIQESSLPEVSVCTPVVNTATWIWKAVFKRMWFFPLKKKKKKIFKRYESSWDSEKTVSKTTKCYDL